MRFALDSPTSSEVENSTTNMPPTGPPAQDKCTPEHDSPHPPPQDPTSAGNTHATHRSALRYIDANYHHSSHSLADTQFTADSPQYNWRKRSSCNLNMGASINSSPHLPRTTRLYYLQAGNLNNTTNPATFPLTADEHTLLTLVPPDTAARPDWRSDALASGRAGSYYDYSAHPRHLRDRLFWQAAMLPADVALQGATTQAIQDFAALGNENRLLELVVGEKEVRVRELEVRVGEMQERLGVLRGEIEGMERRVGELDACGEDRE